MTRIEGLVTPTAIPFEDLKRRDLEECLFWLLDSMGARDIAWRVGGKGDGAPDQGRDIEAKFYLSTPDGELQRETWWIEAKGRTGAVPSNAVKEAVLNGSRGDIDVLVIATNSIFSNPTREWLRVWQQEHLRPHVKLWDKTFLEKLLCQHPEVVCRLFSHALTLQGQLEVIRYRFWGHSTYSGKFHLKELWNQHAALEWDHNTLLAVIASECANGRLEVRPWVTIIPQKVYLQVLKAGFLNAGFFLFRAQDAGVDPDPYFRALSYLVMGAFLRFPESKVRRVIQQWSKPLGSSLPESIRELLTRPVLTRLTSELRDICTSDCARISTELVTLNKTETEFFWYRFTQGLTSGEDEEAREPILTLEQLNAPCKIGLNLDRKNKCPFNSSERNELQQIALAWRVINARKPSGVS